MIGIYKITCNVNGKVYIGSSNRITNRWKQHIDNLNNNKHHCLRLQKDWNELGMSNFLFSIEELCDENTLTTKEQEHINFYLNNYELYNTSLKVKRNNTHNRKYSKYIYIPIKLLDNTLNYSDIRLELFILKQFLEYSKNEILKFSCTKYFEYFNLTSNSRQNQLRTNIEKINNCNIFNINLSSHNSVINIRIKDKFLKDEIYNKNNCFKIKCTMDELLKLSNYKLLSILYTISINNNSYIWNIKDFKKYLNIDGKYKNFSDVKIRVLDKFIEEANKIGYLIKYEPIKLGNSINEIKFTIGD